MPRYSLGPRLTNVVIQPDALAVAVALGAMVDQGVKLLGVKADSTSALFELDPLGPNVTPIVALHLVLDTEPLPESAPAEWFMGEHADDASSARLRRSTVRVDRPVEGHLCVPFGDLHSGTWNAQTVLEYAE